MDDKLLYRPVEAAQALGISRSRAYELIADGSIPSIKLGSSVRVPVQSLRDWIDRQVAEHIEQRRARA